MWMLVRRFAQMLVILAALSFVLFGLLSAMPGDPVDMLITSNPNIKPEDVVRLKKLRGLDKPWYVQYVRWIWGYHDPRRPVTVSGPPAFVVEMPQKGEVTARVDLESALFDPDFRHTPDDLLKAVRARDPAIADELAAHERVRGKGDHEKMSALSEMLYERSPALHQQILDDLARKAARSLEVEGLFGATAKGTVLEQRFTAPGVHAMWFVVRDAEGLETVARVPVYVAPPPPAPKEGAETLDEEEAQLAGSTEAEAATEPPTEAELVARAREVQEGIWVDAIPSQVIDDPEAFRVALKDYVRGIDEEGAAKLRFELLEGSAGTIDGEGIYRHRFETPGQTAIRFSVHTPDGQTAHGAFSVEHGPIPDKERFNRGFLFAFAGDKEALGFSNTYKRPVWEILAGSDTECGDSMQGPGETCDDGNTVDGDGCSSVCQLETLSFWERLDARAAGWLITSGRIVNTVSLMLPAILFSLLIAIPIGVLSAYRQYSWLDYIVNFLAFIGISLPVFWFGIMVLALFAEKMQVLPAGGIQTPGIQGGFFEVLLDRIKHTLLPAFVLSIAYTGRWLRYMRASMLEVLPLDYIRTARAKGLSEKVVILKHALRNALIPVVTVLALSIPTLFGGAVLTETVFAWPGIGRLQYESVMNNDYYVAIVVFLISSFLVMLGNLLADVLYVVVDPRIRKS